MEVGSVGGVANMVTMRGDGGMSSGNSGSSLADAGTPSTAGTTGTAGTGVGVGPPQGLECHSNGPTSNGDSPWKILPQDSSKMAKIRDIVESSSSMQSKCVVESILQQVGQLTDIEKFLLYLKLPIGRGNDVDPLKHSVFPRPINPLGSRNEIQLTITWIKTHLEMDNEVSLPKREVYNEYMHYCSTNNIKPLSTADFGKVMKQVFPAVRPRRLGQRGASKYCYSGLRKRYTLDPPSLPDLNDNMANKAMLGLDCPVEDGEVERAACCIVMEWAEKFCSVKFEAMRDLALYLVQKNYVDNRSVAAITVASAMDHKPDLGIGSGSGGGGKHRETQLQLQRKLQERENIREQKRKLQEQQPMMSKSPTERSKSRRRSGASSRNPSGDTNSNASTSSTSSITIPITNHSLNSMTTTNTLSSLSCNNTANSITTNTTTTMSSLTTVSNSICSMKSNNLVSLSSKALAAAPPSSVHNGDCDTNELPNGANGGGDMLLSGNEFRQGLTPIKQEDNTLDFLDSITDSDRFMDVKNGNLNSSFITNISHESELANKNSGASGSAVTSANCDSNTSSNKVAIPRYNNSKKAFLIMPQGVNKNASNKPRYKAIQPKATEVCQLPRGIGATAGSGGAGLTAVAAATSQPSNKWGELMTRAQERQASTARSNVKDFQTQLSTGVETVGGDGTQNVNTSGHEAEEELIQYFSKNTGDMDDVQKSSQLSELRKLLQKNLPGSSAAGGSGSTSGALTSEIAGELLDQDSAGPGAMRRRVSFQRIPDGHEGMNPLLGGQTVGPVPPSPNTRRKAFNFTPITTDQPQGMSQCSSANVSPFMSPRNTPLPRSRHNSGQTSSTYVTPRSTPFTPDNPTNPIISEPNTPFMSPIPTPLPFPRSRHNSSQNPRNPYTPTCRSRHSSGAPTFRHAPYGPDSELCGRRGGKFRSRHSSGSVPPSPSSAPLSPLVQDGSVHHPHDPLGLQGPPSSMLHQMLKSKQPGQSYGDLRRRHMSAGPTIHYQPQPPPFPSDTLTHVDPEVSTVMNNSQQANTQPPVSNPNRPQSVPLLQMLQMSSSNVDSFPKSHPNTPVVSQQFSFSADPFPSQPSSYAPTPVPSEYNDFESYNLDLEPMLDVNLGSDQTGQSSLDQLDSMSLNHGSSNDLAVLSDPLQVPPNIDPFSGSYNTDPSSSVLSEQNNLCIDQQQQQQQQQQQHQQQQHQQQQQQHLASIPTSCSIQTTNCQGPMLTANSQLTLNALNTRPTVTLNMDSGLDTRDPPSSHLEEDFQPTLDDLGDQEVFNSLVLDVNKD